MMSLPIVNSKEQVVRIARAHAPAIQACGVRRLGLFGSFVRNQPMMDSDIDLLVEFDPAKKTFDNFINLAFLLEDLFHRRVEVVTPESLSPYMRPHILAEAEYVDLVP